MTPLSGIFREGIEEAIAKLEDPARSKFHEPEVLFSKIGLSRGMKIADLGCGTGYFSVPASKIVGKDGTVFAVDKVPEVLDVLTRKIKSGKIANIKVLRSDLLSTGIESHSIDMGFIACVFHDVDQDQCLAEAERILKPGGRFAILEWKKVDSERGPPLKFRLNQKDIESALRRNGWTAVEAFEIGPLHHVVVGRTPAKNRKH
jgi:ubiquinone/menaquinone biosynthesis C-methylase UbiE